MATPILVSEGAGNGAILVAALMFFALVYEVRRSFDDLKDDGMDPEFEQYRKGEMTIHLVALLLTVGYISVVILEESALVACNCSQTAAILLLIPLITITGSAAMKWKNVVTGFKRT